MRVVHQGLCIKTDGASWQAAPSGKRMNARGKESSVREGTQGGSSAQSSRQAGAPQQHLACRVIDPHQTVAIKVPLLGAGGQRLLPRHPADLDACHVAADAANTRDDPRSGVLPRLAGCSRRHAGEGARQARRLLVDGRHTETARRQGDARRHVAPKQARQMGHPPTSPALHMLILESKVFATGLV